MTFTKYALIYLSFLIVALIMMGILLSTEPDRKQQCLSISSANYKVEWKEEKCWITIKD